MQMSVLLSIFFLLLPFCHSHCSQNENCDEYPTTNKYKQRRSYKITKPYERGNSYKVKCKTVEGKLCIFPFVWVWIWIIKNNNKIYILVLFRYGGITFSKCTTYNSEDGQPWCSTMVYTKTRELVRNKFGICDFGLTPADVVQPRDGLRDESGC